MSEDTSSTVRVAVRIRPQLPRETIDGCRICTNVSPDEPQVWIGGKHSYTYDNVFDIDSHQEAVFDTVKPLLDGCMEGYNATILAYGQTGSGKTYTMGTAFEIEQSSDESRDKVGIIPRSLHYLFEQIERQRKEAIDQSKPPPEFKVGAQFVELYNEEVFDLIEPGSKMGSNRRATAGNIKIHEDPNKGIYLVGAGTKTVKSSAEAIKCLRDGALCRTTASTNMNDQSSRSHAIFTMHVTQQRVVISEGPDTQNEFETLSAKFHFVDLAGSERLKRTGAVGDRAKEGININCGLLALGNVISALGDSTRVGGHVPYRDSKLTRLLQDSLGGNSKTVMIACVSPSDRDFVETLNTLKYANRAKNIKNKISINQDKSSRTIAVLRQEIQQLQNELMEYKQGRRLSGAGNDDSTSDSWRENTLLRSELANLKSRIKAMQDTIDQITAKNAELLADRAMAGVGIGNLDGQENELHSMVKSYLLENEQLRAKLCEAEAACESLRKSGASLKRSPVVSPRLLPDDSIHNLIRAAKREVEKEQNFAKKAQNNIHHSDEGSNSCDDDDDEEDGDSDQPDIEAELELAEITNDITVKQRLIEQLEATQRKFETMKAQYEEKLMCLSHKIKATEQERDKVLCTVKGEKGKQVKQDYEQKITSLNQELKKLQVMHKEHLKQLKNNSENEKRIQQLRNEMDDMKRMKVKLQNQIKEENVRWREKEAIRLKEINQLKKEQRKKDIAIRTLQGEARTKELVLKRKHEEIVSLKKNKNLSAKASGKVLKPVSPVKAKHQWNKISSSIIKNVTLKQTVANSESEMLALIEERKELQKQLTALQSQKRMMQNRMAPPSDIAVITDDIEAIQAKILYISEKTGELQESIVELSAGREDDPNSDIGSWVSSAKVDEMRYMFLKLYDQNISSMTETANAVQKEASAAEKLKLCENELTMLRVLFQHVMLNCKDESLLPPEIAAQFEILKEAYPLDGLASSVKSISAGSDIGEPSSIPPKSSAAITKARRITSTPSDLLLGGWAGTTENGSESAPELVSPEEFRVTRFRGFRNRDREALATSRAEPSPDATFIVPAQPSSRTSSNGDIAAARIPRVNSMKRPAIEVSAVTRVRGGSTVATNGNATDRHSVEREQEQNESPNATPPGSPNSQRRQQNNDNNVFQRLFQSSSTSSENGGVGTIKHLRAANSGRGLLINEAVAEGHTQQVLSLYATDTRLYSSAKDTFAKIWDLQKGVEIQTLYGHPQIVQCVTANEENHLVVTASSYFIKLWDTRSRSCIATLVSSGLRHDQAPTVDINSRILRCPANEYVVNSLCLGVNDLYSTYHDKVRRWDLRAPRSVGVLPCRHNSAVTSLLLLDNGSLVTGSKDHSIRVFENRLMDIDPANSVQTAVTQLDPPHYDGVECFAQNGSMLFSGSRDMCIKKWDLERKQLSQSINNAHGAWITGLAMAPSNNSLLLSTGKEGIIKVWNVEDGRELYKVDTAKRGLSCIVSNSNQIFTGCQDGTISLWKLRKNHHDLSPDSSGSSDISA